MPGYSLHFTFYILHYCFIHWIVCSSLALKGIFFAIKVPISQQTNHSLVFFSLSKCWPISIWRQNIVFLYSEWKSFLYKNPHETQNSHCSWTLLYCTKWSEGCKTLILSQIYIGMIYLLNIRSIFDNQEKGTPLTHLFLGLINVPKVTSCVRDSITQMEISPDWYVIEVPLIWSLTNTAKSNTAN